MLKEPRTTRTMMKMTTRTRMTMQSPGSTDRRDLNEIAKMMLSIVEWWVWTTLTMNPTH